MESNQVEQLKTSLVEKRQNLAEWLENAEPIEKAIQLGPCDIDEVREHIHVLDEALVKADGGALGRCKVCGDLIEDELLLMDYTAEVCLSHLSPAEARHLEQELELSKVVQKALMPSQPPSIAGLELAAFNRPAQILGGDFYDFLQFRDGRAGIIIGDVAGKGVSASLLMASAQTALRTLIPDHLSPADVLRRINHLFAHNALYPTFVTLFLGAYDPGTQTLTYSNAGHSPPLLLQQTGGMEPEICQLKPTGPAVGLLEQPPLWDESIQLAPGDLFFLYTDGVTEAFSPRHEQYGMERLESLLRRGRSLDLNGLMRTLLRELQDFMESQSPADDITMVIGRVVSGE